MRPSRIQAIDNVCMEGPVSRVEDLRWFYTTIGALREAPADGKCDSTLRFRSARIELSVRLVGAPQVEPIRRRVTLAVPSLDAAMSALDERGMTYVEEHGLSFTDRRVVVQDPAGHRIELKRDWPDSPL